MTNVLRTTVVAICLAFVATACSGNVFSLEVGDCFNDTEDVFGGEVSDVPIVDCSEPHDNEVYFTFDSTASSFPGDDAITELAFERCLDEFESFVGRDYATSRYDIFPITPTAESWDRADDREIICALYDVDLAKLEGSAKGTEE